MKYKNLLLVLLTVLFFMSCQQLDDSIDLNNTTTDPQTTDYYILLEEALDQVFEKTYKNVTIHTSMWEIMDMFERNTEVFFASKGFQIIKENSKSNKNSDSNNSIVFYAQLSNEQRAIINNISKSLQSSDYHIIRSKISEIRKSAIENMLYPESNEICKYLKHVDNVLDIFEKYGEKMKMLKIIGEYNEFHEIECTQSQTRTTLADGMYPHPFDSNKFIMIVNGLAFEFYCGSSLNYNDTCKCCDYSSGSSGLWGGWGNCISQILSISGSSGSITQDLANAMADAINGVYKGILTGC